MYKQLMMKQTVVVINIDKIVYGDFHEKYQNL